MLLNQPLQLNDQKTLHSLCYLPSPSKALHKTLQERQPVMSENSLWKYQHTNHRMHFASYFYSACHQKIEHQLHLLLHPPQKDPTVQRSCPSLSALTWQHMESSDEAFHDRTSTRSKQGPVKPTEINGNPFIPSCGLEVNTRASLQLQLKQAYPCYYEH